MAWNHRPALPLPALAPEPVPEELERVPLLFDLGPAPVPFSAEGARRLISSEAGFPGVEFEPRAVGCVALDPLAGTALGLVVLVLGFVSVLFAPGTFPVAPVLVAAGLVMLLLLGIVALPAAFPVLTAFSPGMPPLTPVPGPMMTGRPGSATPPLGSRLPSVWDELRPLAPPPVVPGEVML